MRDTDMAVVISQSQNEIAEMAERGLDIKPHRKRMVEENLEDKFKDAQDPFRIAFVCSMWTTGFDVPSLSTVYLDKPLRNHTLMQTITRANRVFPEKNNGLIVAYVDVFSNLQKALAIYAVGGKAGEVPVEEKGALVEAVREAVEDLRAFCAERDVDLDALGRLKGFELVAAGKQTVEMLMVDDDEKIAFLSRAALVDRLYKAILPDKRANEFSRVRAVTKFLADGIAAYTERPDVSGVLGRVEQLLDESVAAHEYLIPDSDAEALFDLGAVDWKDSKKRSNRDGRAPPLNVCDHCSQPGSPRSFASTRCVLTWSNDSRSSSPTTTPGASTPRRSSNSYSTSATR